jgi:hypothetical protein
MERGEGRRLQWLRLRRKEGGQHERERLRRKAPTDQEESIPDPNSLVEVMKRATEFPAGRGTDPDSVFAKLERSTGFPLPATTIDFAWEMLNLGKDEESIRDLAVAHYVWETRFDGDRGNGRPRARERTQDQRVSAVLSDLDKSALYADALVEAGGDEMEVYNILEAKGDGYIGPIRRKYREVSGYPLIS